MYRTTSEDEDAIKADAMMVEIDKRNSAEMDRDVEEAARIDGRKSCRNVRPTHSGWLHKRTHGFFVKKWDRRYFVLDKNKKELKWWRRKADATEGVKKAACTITLHDKMLVVLDVPEQDVGKRSVFKIEDALKKNSRKRKEFYLAVDSEFNKYSWVTQIWDVIDPLGTKSADLGLAISFHAKLKSRWSQDVKRIRLPWVVYLPVRWSDTEACRETEREMRRALRRAGVDPSHRMAITSVLRLLCPDVRNCVVRLRAMEEIKKFEDDELLAFMLQFVQAIRFDISRDTDTSKPTRLARILVERAASSLAIANSLRWLLQIEVEAKRPEGIVDVKELIDQFNDLGYELSIGSLSDDFFDGMLDDDQSSNNPAQIWRHQQERFRAAARHMWDMFTSIDAGDVEHEIGNMLRAQEYFVKELGMVWKEATTSKTREKIAAKKARLRQILSRGVSHVDGDPETVFNTALPSLDRSSPIMHPLNTDIRFRRIDPYQCSLFRSAQAPMLVTCTNGIVIPPEASTKEEGREEGGEVEVEEEKDATEAKSDETSSAGVDVVVVADGDAREGEGDGAKDRRVKREAPPLDVTVVGDLVATVNESDDCGENNESRDKTTAVAPRDSSSVDDKMKSSGPVDTTNTTTTEEIGVAEKGTLTKRVSRKALLLLGNRGMTKSMEDVSVALDDERDSFRGISPQARVTTQTPERREVAVSVVAVDNLLALNKDASFEKSLGEGTLQRVYVSVECGLKEELTKEIAVTSKSGERFDRVKFDTLCEMTFNNIGPDNPAPTHLCVTIFGITTKNSPSSSLRRRVSSNFPREQLSRELTSPIPTHDTIVLTRMKIPLETFWDQSLQDLSLALVTGDQHRDESSADVSSLRASEFRKATPGEPLVRIEIDASVQRYVRRSTRKRLKLFSQLEDAERAKCYRFIFKSGDDMRQDVLIVQLIELMDSWLKTKGMDANMSPYRILTTSLDTGMVELVANSTTLSAILEENGSILQFFKDNGAASRIGDLGVKTSVLNTFVHSCAAYSVITYILGLGDRHFDNLMLKPTGEFFHIDFGWAFGHDPKPYPSKMRLNKDIIDGMGGVQSMWYGLFEKLCVDTFLILRTHVDEIVTLLSLMESADIHHMGVGREAKQTVDFVRDNCMPELDDKAAEEALKGIIMQSIKAVMPEVMEYFHRVAVSFK